MIQHAVVVGGAGAVGALFTERLLETGVAVTVVDRVAPGRADERIRRLQGDVTAVDPALAAELGRADVVVLALPDAVALAAVGPVTERLRPDALLVDTLSVKQPITEAIRARAPGVQAVGLNPMFAPSLGFPGRPVAAVTVNGGPRVAEFLALVRSWGADVVQVDAVEHDRLAGAAQVLTHAAVLGFGLTLAGLGVPAADLRRIAPPPANTLLALLARIASGTPEVYRDVQAANPEAPRVRKALADNLQRLASVVESGTEADFTAVLTELRDYLGDDLAHHRDTCARLFSSV
ncbi:prephenate dehydrogenase/arogenate dehydrogenase family protein [Streptomyces sp. DT24]|uniref:prephenate dehydrogenase n=1 Tax=unclassified Streptomyces TaxID=2593676 RepID=UPI0023B8DE66|nr:prephenate dehydrogenase [Streptomyces sp. AM 4-1-1]WEH34911.1 prephenate dehydrogenase [Streptomyces sp. AM 4-1-1]